MTILRDRGELRTLAASSARGASGNSGTLTGFADSDSLRLQLEVTAVAGITPTLDVVIEDSLDGTNWNTVATFAQKTATSREVLNLTTPFADTVRARWTIGGSGGPSFTFSVLAFVQ